MEECAWIVDWRFNHVEETLFIGEVFFPKPTSYIWSNITLLPYVRIDSN